MEKPGTKRGKRGRPETREWPDPIPDTPENIARVLMNTPPKKPNDWRYPKKQAQ